MGDRYEIRCSSCGYGLEVTEGVGWLYSPKTVFYGHCNDPPQNWSVAFPDGYCEFDKPLLFSLVKNKSIRNKAFDLLANGAKPKYYGHELYMCPECMRFSNRFYFRLRSPDGNYEPDYKCGRCKTELKRVMIESDDVRTKVVYTKYKREVNWKCPKCGGKEIESNHGGISMTLWD